MTFNEQDLFGVYIAPIVPMLFLAWFVTAIINYLVNRYDLIRYFWHPPIFTLSLYTIVLSTIVLFFPI